MSAQRKVVVVGSLNIDYFTQVRQFPRPGETVVAGGMSISFGGKGANQAVAAARLGAQVEMIGCVGDDAMGQRYIERLDGFGIGTDGLVRVAGASTGSAFINVDESGENTIVVSPGANGLLSKEQIEEGASLFEGADCLLLQNEIAHEANKAAAVIAKSNGVELLYNPAPWRDGTEVDDWGIGLWIANEIEAASLFGELVTEPEHLRGKDSIVVTRGAESTLAYHDKQTYEVEPPATTVVDSVGAGDTFVGALAALGLGDFEEALGFANLAAALATTKLGAQEAMPTVGELG